MSVAHQYKIRLKKQEEEQDNLPFNLHDVNLNNTTLKLITKKEAEYVIVNYEWLKKMPGFSKYFFGLYFNINGNEHLGGVLVYSPEYSLNTGVWDKYGFTDKLLLLSRGVCLWWTPKNTASYFISRANKWIKDNTQYRIITATVDPMAGEVGTIYQSLNWYYVGLMNGNYSGNNESKRMTIIIGGKQYSTRYIRKKYGTMKKDEILKIHPDAVFVPQYRKRRYFYFMDSKYNNKKYLDNISHLIQPYPKRNEKDISGVIYMITNNLNNKKYIGQTIRGFFERYNEYKSDLNNKSKSNNIYLYNSFVKYGFENFKFEIIDTAKSIDELNEKEIQYIKKYNTTNREFGYNLHEGGRNSPLSMETREKMSINRKGKPKDENWIKKAISPAGSEEAKKYGKPKTEEEKKYLSENSPKYWQGKKRDEETVKKMSQSKKLAGIKPPNTKKMVMIDSDGNLVKIYESAKDCSFDSGYSYDQIYDRLRGKYENNLNHKFYYLENYSGEYNLEKDLYIKPKGEDKNVLVREIKNVVICNSNNEYIKTVSSVVEASKETGVHHAAIRRRLAGEHRNQGDYYFHYEYDWDSGNLDRFVESDKNKPMAVVMYNIITGEDIKEYNSINEAANDNNIDAGIIRRKCEGKNSRQSLNNSKLDNNISFRYNISHSHLETI